MKKHTLYFAAIAATIATPAVAAGPAPSWTGFYIGGNVGGATERASGTSNFLQAGDSAAPNPQLDALNPSSPIGGGQFGFNWQVDQRWLVGIEGDWDFMRSRYSFCRQTDTDSAACFDNGAGFETIGGATDWLATARGRLGIVTSSNMLLYVTGGVAWGQVKTNLAQSCLADGCGLSTTQLAASNSSTTDKAGWVAGLGAAVPIGPNWSARLEWLHIDLGNITGTLTTPGAIPGPTTSTTVWSRGESYDVIRVGLDYRFGAP